VKTQAFSRQLSAISQPETMEDSWVHSDSISLLSSYLLSFLLSLCLRVRKVVFSFCPVKEAFMGQGLFLVDLYFFAALLLCARQKLIASTSTVRFTL